jgi:hypothetical protein
MAFVSADRRSEGDFFRSYAAARGLVHEGGRLELEPLTPLLGAGDRRWCEHWMRLPAGAGPEVGLGHYTYEAEHGHGREKNVERRRFTICVTDLGAGIRLFPAIFLCRRASLLEKIDRRDWLSHVGRHEVELESAALCAGHALWVDDGQDELLLRELFTPSFEVLLAEHPLAPCLEYRAGTLVVYVERQLDDEGHLDMLRDVTAKIAARFAAEVEEAGARA